MRISGRAGFLLFVAALACLAWACTVGGDDDDDHDDDAGDDDDDAIDDDDDDDDDAGPPPRSFYLSAAPMQYALGEWTVETVFDTSGFDGLVDVLSLHMDGFFGLPWDTFAVGAPPPGPWVAVMEDIRAQARELGAEIFLSITPLDGMRAALTPLAYEEEGDASCFLEAMARDAPIRRDRFGVSSYPEFYIAYFGSISEDYYTGVGELTGERVVFAEIGAGSHSIVTPYPTLEDPCILLFDWSSDDKIAFMQSLFEDAQALDSDLICWWSLVDYLPLDVLIHCPCDAPGLWCVLYEAVHGIGLLEPWLMWGSMGVLDYELNPKPSLVPWQQWLARPVETQSP